MTPHAMRYVWVGDLGESSCDGTLARSYARGGYVALGWSPPSRQGTEVPRRGVADARVTRPFARAKRGPRNGVSPAAPRRATRKGLAPRSAPAGWGLRAAPVPSVGDLSNGGGRPGRARPTATPAQPVSTPTSSSRHTTSAKKKRFFSDFFPLRRLPPGPEAPRVASRARRVVLRLRGH